VAAIESTPALVKIADLPLLALTDRFDDRQTFTDLERSGAASNVNATREGPEPRHDGKPGGKSLWLAWQAPQDGTVTFSTAGSSFDTLLAVYTGSTLAELRRPENLVASDDDIGGFLTSQVAFNARKGQVYQVAVDGFAGQSGTVVLGWRLVPTPVDQTPPAIAPSGQPASVVAIADLPRATQCATSHPCEFNLSMV
jgi:hypothetical protein